jgi:molybdate transport system ATP-binding protein
MASRYLAVNLRDIELARGGRRVLRGLSWRIRPGQRWVLQGNNGAGKTQLLKLIAGDVWPQPHPGVKREYLWHGECHAEPLGVREEIAYVGAERQDRYEHYGWNHCVLEIVGTGLQRSDIPLRRLTTAERQRVLRLLQRLGLVGLAGRGFLTLSHGERRLVLLARALAWRPALLLLDEPLNGLDARNRTRMLAMLDALGRSSLPWIYATHRLDEAPRVVTHWARLDQGRLRTGTWRRRPQRSARAAVRKSQPARSARRARRAASIGALLMDLRNAWVWREGKAVLRGVSLQIHAGDCWVVHGANGSGKSSFLGLLHGDFGAASQGAIWRRGQAPGAPLAAFQRRVGCVAPELQAALPRQLPALDALAAGLRGAFGLDGAATARERAAARQALRRVGAQRSAQRILAQLSYGQMRRVLFARALARHPDILLLDEPYTGLDARTRVRLRGLVDTYPIKEGAIVIASHHRDEWPRRATHELELAGGRVRYCGVRRW